MFTKESETKLEYMNKKIKIGEVISLDTTSDVELKDMSFIKLVESDRNYYLAPCNFEGISTVEDLKTLVSLDKWSEVEIDELVL